LLGCRTVREDLIVGAPLPTSIGRCADLYAETRELRLAMEKEVEPIKKREAEIREHIINSLSKSDYTGASGLRYRAQIVIKKTIKVADWGVLHSWIRKNDRFDALQKRINETAAKDFLDVEGRTLPGTEVINVPEVSITKL
jgi:hypothetical protein